MEWAVFHIIKMNVIAGIFVLLVAGISKGLGRRYSARWKYWCWMILAVFLLIPVDFSSYLAVVQVEIPAEGVLSPVQSRTAEMETMETEGDYDVTDGMANNQEFQDSNSAAGDSKEAMAGNHNIQVDARAPEDTGAAWGIESVFRVWIVSIVIILCYQILKYQIAHRQLMRWSYPAKGNMILNVLERQRRRMGLRKAPQVMMNARISSPMIAGLWKPCMFIPEKTYSYGQLELICHHELVHYAHKDIWYKTLLMLVRSIYWFNPALAIMMREAEKDLEYICDEKVMKNANKEKRYTYNQLLISAAGRKSGKILFSTGFNGGLATFKKRMANIMYMKKRKKGICIGGICCALFLGGGILIGCTAKASQPSAFTSKASSNLMDLDSEVSSSVTTIAPEIISKSSDGENAEEHIKSGWIGEIYYDEQGNVVADNSPYEYIITNQGQYLNYYNRIYGFSFQVPVGWESSMSTSQYVKDDMRRLSFSDRANTIGDDYGYVFSIVVSDMDQEEEQISSEGQYLYHFKFNGEDKALYKIGPTDMQIAPPYSQQLMTSYQEKTEQMYEVLNTVSFETEDLGESNRVSKIQPASAYAPNQAIISETEDVSVQQPVQSSAIELLDYLFHDPAEAAGKLGLTEAGREGEYAKTWKGDQAYLATLEGGQIDYAVLNQSSDSTLMGVNMGMSKEEAQETLFSGGWRFNSDDGGESRYLSGEMDTLTLAWGEDGTVRRITWSADS